jgi:hypothetical protein
MAGQQEQSDNVLGQIFDMAFTPKKKENPRRPVDLRGITASDEFTKNLIDFVSSPMTQAAQSTAGIVDSTFGSQGVLSFKLDGISQRGYDDEAGDVKVKVKDIKKFMENPGQFIKKANDAARKQRASMLLMGAVGETYSELAVTAFAKKNGMSMKEARALGIAAKDQHTSAHNKEVINTLTEIASLNATGNATQARKLTLSLQKKITSLTSPDEFFAITKETKSKTPKLPGLVLVDKVTLADSAAAIDKQVRATYIKGHDSEKIFAKVDEGKKLSVHEKQIYSAYQRDVAKLAKKNMEIRSLFTKETAGMSDSERQNAWKAFSGKFNGQVSFLSDNDSLSSFGALKNQGYIKMQSDLNKAKYWQTMGQHQETKTIGDKKERVDKKYVKDGLAGKALPPRDKEKFEQYKKDEAENVKYLKAQVLADSLQNMMLPNVTAAQQAIVKVSNKLAKSPGSRKYYEELQRELQRLNRITQRPGGIGSAPAWRQAVLGNGYGNEHGVYKGRNGNAVSKAMRKMYLAQAEDASNRGMNEQSKMFMELSRGVSRMPGFDVNGAIARVKYIQSAAAWKDAVVKGGFAGAMFGGALWDMDFGPSKRVENFKAGNLGFDEDGKIVGKDLNYVKGFIVLPRDEIPIYNKLTALYYTTPGAVLKTLFWNGEGFAYSSVQQNRYMLANIAKTLGRNQTLLAQLKASGDFDDFISGSAGKLIFNGALLQDSKNLERLYKKFDSLGGGFSGLAKMMEYSAKNIERLQRWHKFASAPSGAWRTLVDGIKGKALAPIGVLLRAFSKNATWTAGVDNFVAGNLGLRQLAEIVAKKAINLIASGIGGPIGTALSFALTEVIMKVIEPILALAMWALRAALVLIAMLILAFFMKGSFRQPKTLPSYGISPTSVDYLYQDTDSAGIECPTTGPIVIRPGQSCPVEPITGCTAGPEWHTTYSTRNFAMDVQGDVWVAPSDGNVTFASHVNLCRTDGSNYGGWTTFVDGDGNSYRIMHATPLVGTGPVKKGTVIARMQGSDELSAGGCWTGPHFHLDINSGGWQNAVDWYTSLGCNVPACNPP